MMTELGNWLKNVPPFRAALGLLLLAVTASFSLGAATVKLGDVPRRVLVLEERSESADSALSEISRKTDQIWCVVRLMAGDNGPIEPREIMDCS